MSVVTMLKRPDPKTIANGIEKRAETALKALENTNKGKNAERTGVSSKTLGRLNIR